MVTAVGCTPLYDQCGSGSSPIAQLNAYLLVQNSST